MQFVIHKLICSKYCMISIVSNSVTNRIMRTIMGQVASVQLIEATHIKHYTERQ